MFCKIKSKLRLHPTIEKENKLSNICKEDRYYTYYLQRWHCSILSKAAAIMDWNQPNNVIEVKSFLGLVGY